MRIGRFEFTEGIGLTLLGLVFFSVVGSTYYYFRNEIAMMRFLVSSNNIYDLIDQYEVAQDPVEKLNVAMKISYHEASSKMAYVGELSKSLYENRPVPAEPREPTGREGQIIRNASEYVGWAFSLLDYYTSKIPPEKMAELFKETRVKLKEEDFKDDITDQDLAGALPKFGSLKPCTIEDFDHVVKETGLENVMKFGNDLFTANLRFSGVIAETAGNSVLREAIKVVDNPEHDRILRSILELQEMGPLIKDSLVSKSLWRKRDDWKDVRELVQTFRRSAPHCFQTRNYMTFMSYHRGAKTGWAADRLAEKIKSHIRQNGQMPANVKDIPNVEYDDLRDAWYSDFKVERTESEIVISSPGHDRKLGTDDDFILRREFIYGN